MLDQYFRDVFNTTKTGDATEESYYPDIKRLFENWGKEKGKNLYITSLPKRTDAGNPDFRIWDGENRIIGYIEAKSPSTENLSIIEHSEQLNRYRKTFHNLILTNFFEFRLYREGKLVNQVKIGKSFIIHKLKMIPPVENQEEFLQFLEQFLSFSVPKTTTPKQLAIELAKRTRFLRDHVLTEELKERRIGGTHLLEEFYKAFKDHLISSLTIIDFSDLFAQTITYGLFTARSRAETEFNRISAYNYIPHTIGILRDVFRYISSTDLPTSMEWIIDDIAEVLNKSDISNIMHNFYEEGKGEDPIVHFYETFLAEYDPKIREKRGIYYTPEPVVSYITRSVHNLLKVKFDKQDGFADHSVTVLDPAAGTLTFPAQAIQLAVEEFKNKYGDGGIKSLISDHILKNFYAFELMMAPYAVGHMKIGFVLDELGYKLTDQERFNLYLTNALDFNQENPDNIPGILEKTIAEESEQALDIKEKIPVIAIIGNPPYSVSSSNTIREDTEFFKLYDSYKEKVRKEERNIQPLSDDYIKFIAFAHWKISKAGQGIIGMITNNSYLDGLIHRDMRNKLLNEFNEIYILNLHGNAKRQETTPSGEKDENVFDIQQGVSIILLVKQNGLKNQIKYCDLWGLRNKKYEFLNTHDVTNTNWEKIEPKDKYGFFVKKDYQYLEKYKQFFPIQKIMEKRIIGVTTGKDDVLVDFSKEELNRKLSMLDKDSFYLLMRNYEVEGKLIDTWYKELSTVIVDEQIMKYSYRPFDTRFIVYNKKILQRSRYSIMKNMFHDNLGIICMKGIRKKYLGYYFIVNNVVDRHILDLAADSAYVFPLYLYEEETKHQQIPLQFQDQSMIDKKQPNINLKIIDWLEQTYGEKITPKEIINYIYAVLFSNSYRNKYKEFLKTDFPRIPFIKDYELFEKLVYLGGELIDFHLLTHSQLNKPIAKFCGKGTNLVVKREYNETQNRVYINDHQYFEGIDVDIWNYFIGGYQVSDKWLKDRKGHSLSSEDIKHYCRIITSLAKTIDLQKNIDNIYEDVEEQLLSFKV